jgi:phytoene dehydrogenase-like protein
VLKVREAKEGYFRVETKRKDIFHADAIVFNLPPWNILSLLDGAVPSRLRRMSSRPRDGWGAFMAYLGLDAHGLNEDMALHHQVIRRSPLGEGNSIFMSLSPAWDESRAPEGKRALTISTHTALEPWWDLFKHDQAAYEDRKAEYLERLLAGAREVLPDIKERIELSLPGTGSEVFRRPTSFALGDRALRQGCGSLETPYFLVNQFLRLCWGDYEFLGGSSRVHLQRQKVLCKFSSSL